MRTPWLAALLFLITLTTSCSSLEVKSEADPQANLSAYKTFAWAKVQPPSGSRAGPEVAESADTKIRKAFETALADAGIRPAPAGVKPDFLLYYYADIQDRVTVTNGGVGVDTGMGAYPAWGGYATTGTSTYEYEEGNLTVDFVDPKTESSFFRGVATDTVNEPGHNDEKIKNAVNEMVAKFEKARESEVG